MNGRGIKLKRQDNMLKTIREWLDYYDVEIIYLADELKLDQKMLKPLFIMFVWNSSIGLTDESLTDESVKKITADAKGLYQLFDKKYSGWENHNYYPFVYYGIDYKPDIEYY